MLEYIQAIISTLLRLMWRFWYITAILVIILSLYCVWTYKAHLLSKQLKNGAYIIAESAILWWNTPVNLGGAGKKSLDQVDFSTFYLNDKNFASLQNLLWVRLHPIHNTSTGEEQEAVDLRSNDGFFQIVPISPHQIKLGGVKLSEHYNVVVLFDTTFDLSKDTKSIEIITEPSMRTSIIGYIRMHFLKTVKMMVEEENPWMEIDV